MSLRLVVTGTGCCGTTYMAAALTASGMQCGHQEVFHWWGVMNRPDLEADCSWLAVPFLDGLKRDGVQVIHLVRDPLAVVRSLVGRRWFGTPGKTLNGGRRFLRRHFAVTGNDVADAMRLYCEWNERIEPHADMRVRIEDPPDQLFSTLGLEFRAPAPESVHSLRRAEVTLPRGKLRERLYAVGARYGYAKVRP